MSFENEDRYVGFDPFKKLEEYEERLDQFYRGMDLIFEDPLMAKKLIENSISSDRGRKKKAKTRDDTSESATTITTYKIDGEPVSKEVAEYVEHLYDSDKILDMEEDPVEVAKERKEFFDFVDNELDMSKFKEFTD